MRVSERESARELVRVSERVQVRVSASARECK